MMSMLLNSAGGVESSGQLINTSEGQGSTYIQIEMHYMSVKRSNTNTKDMTQFVYHHKI